MTNHDEILDVVNERNEVIGQMERDKAHEDGLWHRHVHVFIFNSKGELLLQKRRGDLKSYPGAWISSASGHIETGEAPLRSAKRELKEELGIAVPLKNAGIIKIEPQKCFIYFFTGIHDGKVVPQPEEVAGFEYSQLEKVTVMTIREPEKFAPNFLKLFEFFMKRGGMKHAKR